MREKITAILAKIQLPHSTQNLVEAQTVDSIQIETNSITVRLHIPLAIAKFAKAIETTVTGALTKELQFTGEIHVHVAVQKANEQTGEGGVSQVKYIIAVASGKGGVGKSTVSANLAVALAQAGLQVGLLDADIFGPSIPKMFNIEHERPVAHTIGDKDFIVPIESYGVKILSIGFFVDSANAVIWRGPMAGNALKQLITEADWGALDVLLIDMPPGTSDIQLTLSQIVNINGAIMVSTPQDIALIDVVKGIDFFEKQTPPTPLLGIIENMAWFTPEELPDNKYYIFGKGGAKTLAAKRNIPFLGEIPIVQSIREGGDSGSPVALQAHSLVAEYYTNIAKTVMEKLSYNGI
ncbi:MAG: Mrp/NBP35 family ATP-binding protein [Bacteroidales bacterium]|jgi:ATP-binding protein involved in chromosome partitioning|nr:Mrp/NBP35 family ATP-binding protein [Bacteroidales bacterium]